MRRNVTVRPAPLPGVPCSYHFDLVLNVRNRVRHLLPRESIPALPFMDRRSGIFGDGLRMNHRADRLDERSAVGEDTNEVVA